MTASQITGLILGIRKRADFISPELAAGMMTNAMFVLMNILQSLGAITFPLLLIASMSIVMRDRSKIFRVMLSNFALAALTYLFIVTFAEGLIRILLTLVPKILLQIPNLNGVVESVLTGVIDKFTNGDLMGTLAARGISPELLQGIISAIPGVEVPEGGLAALTESLKSADLAGIIANSLPEILDQFGLTSDQAMDMIASRVTETLVRSHLNMNIFLDLFLCTAFFFFADYQPKRLTGGKLLLFRCGAILPACYLLIGVVLTGMNRAEWIEMNLPVRVVALLPSRKLPGLLLFLSMMLYIKYHEAEITAKGGGKEEMNSFMQSNRGSWRFSLFISVILIILSLGDWTLSKVAGGMLSSWGIGVTSTLYMAIPFVLLFSFSRRPKFKFLDAFVTVYYILHYVILFFVAMYLLYAIPQLLSGVPFGSIDMEQMGTRILTGVLRG